MKTIPYFKTALFAIAALLMAGCGDDAPNSAITDNNAYIKNAYENKFGEIYIDKDGSQTVLPIAVTRKDDSRDIKVSVAPAPEALEAYNSKYNKDYVLYPTDLWKFESAEVTVKKGSAGTYTTINISAMPKELSETGSTYVIPVKLDKAEGIGTLEGANTMLYILRNIPYADVPEMRAKRIQFKMDHKADENKQITFHAMTVEFLFKITSWSNANNKALFYNNGRTVKNELYSRLEGGSAGLDKAGLEFKIGDYMTVYPASGKFEMNKWYHAAMAWGNKEMIIYIDGKQAGRKDVAIDEIISSTDITPNGTKDYMGYCWEGGATSTGMQVAEIRLWDVKRTKDQIAENMYSVNPQTKGLIGYWRMNEGQGNTFRDYANPDVGGGFVQDGSIPTWVPNQELTVGK
jgi:hypothetical protein